MKLQAQIGESISAVELIRTGDRVIAKIDGREYDLEVSEPEPNIFLFKNDGKVREFFVAAGDSPGSPTLVSSREGEVEIRLIDPKQLRGSTDAAGSATGMAEIRTMMPGKVVRVVSALGDEVEKGDPILVVEAMKMQNDLKSPKSGMVKEIRVVEGATVGAGDVLAIIE